MALSLEIASADEFSGTGLFNGERGSETEEPNSEGIVGGDPGGQQEASIKRE